MKKILLVLCAVIFCSFKTSAQENPCLQLLWPHDPANGFYNPDSVMISKCSESYDRLFAKRGWVIYFTENIFNGPLAPRGTILTLYDIDSLTYNSTYLKFKQLKEDLGDFWFERLKDRSGDSTAPLFDLYFANYVDLEMIISRGSAIPNVKDVGFRYPYRGGASAGDLKDNILFAEISPNPATENITITFPQNQSFKITKLILRDITGREILLKELQAGEYSYMFSLKEFSVGVYILEVHSGGEVFTKQVSVIK
jgi:hypothetical protein